eukprot:COSAG01_NODE_32146_length_585_cov_5.234568_1_plen_46_part_10
MSTLDLQPPFLSFFAFGPSKSIDSDASFLRRDGFSPRPATSAAADQ